MSMIFLTYLRLFLVLTAILADGRPPVETRPVSDDRAAIRSNAVTTTTSTSRALGSCR